MILTPAVANASNQSSPYHLRHIMTSSLQNDAGSHDNGEHNQHPLTTQFFANNQREQSTEKASEVID
jgi:hypothetical protein